MRSLKFTWHRPGGDRRHFVAEADVTVVLERLPASLWSRLKAVHFNDRARGNRVLGYVGKGRAEIALCALPPRVSLAEALRRGRSPDQFGAVRGCQWPVLAVRRFMLYEVFLLELGHLQVIDEDAKTTRRKFASETLAQDFAERWCRELWSRRFDHPDPVHNPPSEEETAELRDGWTVAFHDYKKGLHAEQAKRYDEAVAHYRRAIEGYPGHAFAVQRLGSLSHGGAGTAWSAATPAQDESELGSLHGG
jgi:hypothetical protein